MKFIEENILLIDKPKGITSFDVIRKLRKKLGIRRMGHAGTLDPLASGLMIIGVQEGTKKLRDYLKLSKIYEVEVLLGKKTKTGDMEGEVLEEQVVKEIKQDEVEKTLKGLVGKLNLPVPIYSAIKQGGEALYKKARRGEKVEAPTKEMEIAKIKLNNHWQEGDYCVLEIEMGVSSGTYIRSIAEEIGRRLVFPATVKELRRTKIGDFSIEQAHAII